MAIRKISDEGVTTIASGRKWGHTGHVDDPSEDAKFSNDFDVVYVGSSFSLLVVDRGNQAIREIQLHQDDCTTYDEYDNSFHLGIVVLVAAGFFGYMLALLQQRDPRAPSRTIGTSFATQQRPPRKSVRPPLIPSENEFEKADEGFFVSLGRLLVNSGSSMGEILGDEDEPPGIETRTPTPGNTYPFMTKELEKPQHFKPTQAYFNRWDGAYDE
ncbi:Six-bladed beta-propeller, TolB-like [Sesbania bispinosa]|nr:Six-bladed beta-propeller, TolB-like [Sesbania bispinosa]